MDDDELARYRATFERLHSGPKPQTLEALREWNAEEGLGSILDMLQVGPRGNYGTVSLLTPPETANLFGTTQPTHEQIVQDESRCFDYVKRGQGLAIIVYRDGMPHEIFFAGFSGD
jgi:hypothetical protein